MTTRRDQNSVHGPKGLPVWIAGESDSCSHTDTITQTHRILSGRWSLSGCGWRDGVDLYLFDIDTDTIMDGEDITRLTPTQLVERPKYIILSTLLASKL